MAEVRSAQPGDFFSRKPPDLRPERTAGASRYRGRTGTGPVPHLPGGIRGQTIFPIRPDFPIPESRKARCAIATISEYSYTPSFPLENSRELPVPAPFCRGRRLAGGAWRGECYARNPGIFFPENHLICSRKIPAGTAPVPRNTGNGPLPHAAGRICAGRSSRSGWISQIRNHARPGAPIRRFQNIHIPLHFHWRTPLSGATTPGLPGIQERSPARSVCPRSLWTGNPAGAASGRVQPAQRAGWGIRCR